MKKRLSLVSFIVAILLLTFRYLQSPQQSHAQEIDLLSPPYFGTTRVWNIFDHEYPNYNGTPPGETRNMVHNDNQRLDHPVHQGGPGNIYCTGYSGHDGIDYGLHYNYVRASHSGIVNKAGWASTNHQLSYGLHVVLQTTYNDITCQTVYGHLSSILVKAGSGGINSPVAEGKIIGVSGDTGNSTAPHLHFSVRREGEDGSGLFVVNPYGWNGTPALDPWDALGNEPPSVDLWKSYPSIQAYSTCIQLPYPDGTEIPYPVSGDPPLVPTITSPPYTVIVDDNDNNNPPRFTVNGPGWLLYGCAGMPACYGPTYHSSPKNLMTLTSATYTPRPGELIPGQYDVYAYHPNELDYSNANLAHYYITHNNQLHYAGINQQYFNKPEHPEPKWSYLGRYDFAGIGLVNYERVTVYHEGDVGENLSADAIVFVFVDGPPDLDLQITQGSNDAGHNPNLSCNSLWGEPEIYLGHCNTGPGIVSGFRYSSVDIPANALIKRAHLQFTVDGGASGQPDTDLLNLRFYGERNPDSEDFDPIPPHAPPPTRTLTTAYKSWNVPITDQWLVWQTRYSPNIGPIVQEIVHLPEWEPGLSALTFIVKPAPGSSGNQHRRVMAYERDVDGTHDAHLLIWLACSTPPCPTQ
jgi:murein DD-endopeptidase MepM/ murein hydrolase activator NlpD